MVEKFSALEYRTPENPSDLEVILVTNTHTQLKDLAPALLKKTRLIIHPNSGYDHFAGDVEVWKNIPVVIGHTIRAQAVAEYSISALFEGLVELPQHLAWNKERTWERKLLKGTDVWVFGYGHIGKIIADTLSTLGMKITIVDPFISHCPHKHLKSWKEGNVKEARVVITACGLNSTSNKLFNEEFFSHASDDLLFINGARGKLVDEKALREFLLTHPKAFAFLDVFDLDRSILKFEETVLSDYLGPELEDFFKKYRSELLQNKWMKGVLV
jgi:phosphoglycerate dehydrogenase-like enzyme